MVSDLQKQPISNILFDPQTSGGLLLAVSEQNVDNLVSKLDENSAVIGRIVEGNSYGEQVRLLH